MEKNDWHLTAWGKPTGISRPAAEAESFFKDQRRSLEGAVRSLLPLTAKNIFGYLG